MWLGMADDGGLCALKVVRIPDAEEAGGRGRRRRPAAGERELADLVTEVGILGRLRHDNVVCYMASAVVGSHVVLCMEYVPGGSLDAVLQQFGALAPSSVRRYVREILRGLAYLHAHDVVHRDFKPGNVLLQIDGTCKLADFGASAELKKMAGESGVVGTPLYMAPEAAKGAASAAGDVWGVGVALCEMLAGACPYRFTDDFPYAPLVFIGALRDGRAAAMLELPAEGGPGGAPAADFARRCLAPLPGARPGAAELLAHPFLAA